MLIMVETNKEGEGSFYTCLYTTIATLFAQDNGL